MPHINDTAAQEFIKALDRMQEETVNFFIQAKDRMSMVDLHRLINNRMNDLVLNELNFTGDIDQLMFAYDDILRGISSFATVNETTLQALKNINQATWVANANIEITAIQKEIFNASLTNQWNQKTIINNLKTGVHDNLSEGQINTLIDTSLSTYERNVTTAMMNEMPDDTLYIYVGPADGKTRDICNEMLGAGALTKAEIINRFGAVVLEVGGGFNCRHLWTLA